MQVYTCIIGSDGWLRRPGVQGAGRPDAARPARSPPGSQRPDPRATDRALVHGPAVRHTAPRRPPDGESHHDDPERPGEVALPQSRAPVGDAGALDRAVRVTPPARVAHRQTKSRGGSRGEATE